MQVDKYVEQKVVGYLKHLGLSAEQAAAYLFLLQHGPSTVLAISRGTKTGRTKLYPLLQDLSHRQLITTHERHYGTSYQAQPPAALELLVREHERQAAQLRGQLPSALTLLQQLHNQAPTTTRTVEYHGLDGLKQIAHNTTKAAGELCILEHLSANKRLGKHFVDTLHTQYAARGIAVRRITNLVSQTPLPGATRYLDPAVFAIQQAAYVYDACTALVQLRDDAAHGVEVYNTLLAAQQRQWFEHLWAQASAL